MIDGVSAVVVLGDDLAATRAVANGISRAQANHRRAFVAHLFPESDSSLDDDLPGLSDMVRYGVSLGRAARATSTSPNLFTIDAGAEGVLSPDMLASRRWFSLAEQVQRMGALLILSAPASVPEIATLARQLDGVLTVGDVAAPDGVRVLAQVHSGARMRTGNTPHAVTPVQAPRSRSWMWAAAVALLAVPLAFPGVRARVGLGPDQLQSAVDSLERPGAMTLPDIAPRLTSDAAWSAELRFINSRVDAAALVSSLVDSMPGPTFAPVRMAGEGSVWYRVLSGAFSDSLSAENFLAALRTRGVVPADGGAVTHTPFALLVDSASDNAMARVKVQGYQGRELPAYALRDSTDRWRIYVGAFSEGRDADPMRMVLDSLNIQSTLVVRVGSTS